jgi:predicted DNA-binding transcriptional regulator YafY
MLETSARLLQLLSLLQSRRYWSGSTLASRLEVTTRTVRRDVDKLRSLGYPIRSTSGTEGGYQFSAGSSVPPLMLDDDEAVAVALGLGSAAAGTIAGTEEASLRALAKIDQILPPRLRRRVSALQTMIVTPSGAPPSVDARTLSAIAGACRDQETIGFRYRDHAGAASARSVEPHRLVHTGYRWYLVAWDTDRKDWRTFRVDRFQGRLTTGPHFAQREPPARDLAAYVSRGIAYAPPCRARVKLLIAGDEIAKRFPFIAAWIEPVDEKSCFIQMAASNFETMVAHLVWLGVDFRVTDPPELIAQVRRLTARLRCAVG